MPSENRGLGYKYKKMRLKLSLFSDSRVESAPCSGMANRVKRGLEGKRSARWQKSETPHLCVHKLMIMYIDVWDRTKFCHDFCI